ncbi:hypothetical protein F4818DRAFT_18821 [Hypoxylon cercidicola]|nr:hypothetical protein F4818DRAFT_18821 [Hypoxylon cercidicola]
MQTSLCCYYYSMERNEKDTSHIVPDRLTTRRLGNMSIRIRIENFIDATREHISTMSGRYRISPLDFDQMYQLYQEDTSNKGLNEFIVGHSITHDIASRLGSKPIDVLAAMVGKTADACQKELDAEIALRQAAEKNAAEEREKAKADEENQKTY